MRKDFAGAARVLRDNCEAHGHGESCYALGTYQAIGKGELGCCCCSGPGTPMPELPVAAAAGPWVWRCPCQQRERLRAGALGEEGDRCLGANRALGVSKVLSTCSFS